MSLCVKFLGRLDLPWGRSKCQVTDDPVLFPNDPFERKSIYPSHSACIISVVMSVCPCFYPSPSAKVSQERDFARIIAVGFKLKVCLIRNRGHS